MKRFIIITLCLLSCIQLIAQMQNRIPQLSQKERGTWLEFEVTKQTAATELAQNKNALQLGINDNLSSISIQDDEIGHRHHRYQQTYKGIAIEGAIFILHEKNNRVAKANGNLIPNLNMSVTPAISEATALQAALLYTNAAAYAWQNDAYENLIKEIKNDPNATLYPEGELIIVDTGYEGEARDYKLAYKFDIYALEPETRQYVFIDAQTSEVLKTEERIHSCTDAPASGITNYSGTVDFTACHDSNAEQYILKNTIGGKGMQVFDAVNTHYSPSIPFTDNDNFFESTPTANEVHWAVEKTNEYYYTKHNRESMDGNGMPIYSGIRYKSKSGDTNNSYWNGVFLQFGDGDGVNYTSLTSPDIVAHEYAHGVTDFTANLKYYKEHGALNESFSDIFGEVAERYMRGTNDWIIGADFIIQDNKNGIRNMSNPKDATMTTQQPDTYRGTNWRTGWEDNGGVHTNSGVQNYWFYLLAEGGSGVNDNGDAYTVDSIGMEKAAAIAYRNLAVYLTPNSEYFDARVGAIQAAEDLYGVGSDEALQTEAAWEAVGVNLASMDCSIRDSLTLVALYEATDGANWDSDALWDLTQPMNTWSGVSLDANGCVATVTLYGAGLNGSIPAEIEHLTNLTELNLSSNQLSGDIPPEIGNLINLTKLHLDWNQLSGNIPSEIENLTDITELKLNNNQLSGGIPAEIKNLINLVTLYLGDNQLSGNIPSEIEDVTKLYDLYLSNNLLTGSIPPEVGNLTELKFLYLSNNQLSGCYAPNLINLYDLDNNSSVSDGNSFDAPWQDFQYYGIGACNNPSLNCRYDDSLALVAFYDSTNGANWTNTWDLSQPIDTWYGVDLNGFGCVASLSLYNNQLSGSIPAEIGNLNRLRELTLEDNQLTGSIPPEIGNLTHLVRLYLGDNDLSGSVPSEIGDLISLRDVRLYNNQLSGSIPAEIGNLNRLRELTLEDNQLTGSIPPTIGDLSDLTHLSLSKNLLSGNIPPEIGNLNHLHYFNLSENQLSGSIPAEIGNLNHLISVNLSENQLAGSIPSEIGNLENLTELWLYDNQLSGCYDRNLMRLFYQLNAAYNTNGYISNGNSFDFSWEDFHNTGMGTCGHPIQIVYPGDFNNDSTANVTDLLYWGLAEGSTGFARLSPTSNWTPQDAYEWEAAHEDGNGDGIVDLNDVNILEQNYDSTHVSTAPYTPNSGLLIYEFQLDSIVFEPKRMLYFDLYAKSKTGGALSTHGLSGIVDLSSLPMPYNASVPTMDITNSALSPSASMARYDDTEKQLHFALTRTDKKNQLINFAPIATIIMDVDDLKGGDEVEYRISATSGSLMHANGATVPVGTTELNVLIGNSTGGQATITSSVTSADEQCNLPGWASVEVEGGKIPYSYQWSNGDTTQPANNLTAGIYSLTITDALGANFTRSVEIASPAPIYDGEGRQLDCTGQLIYTTCRQADSLALVAIYDALNGYQWDFTQPMDTWTGITLNTNGCVYGLDLSSSGLNGTLAPQIGDLSEIRNINFSQNSISGTIPSSIGNLSNLESVYLHNNLLTGSIPSEIGDLANLKFLSLRNNQLTGDIPATIGGLTNLESLSLSNNQLTGNIPVEIGHLTNLNALHLSNNQLTGNIPPTIGDLTNLESFYVSNNQLTGNIPTTIGNLSNLEYLYLNNNQLTGNIPATIGNLSNLVSLNAPYNQLTGSIPSSIGDFASILSLNLHDNQLTGEIPSTIGNLFSLTSLYLRDNQLTGNIPATIGDLPNLNALSLSNNELTGNIPPEIGDLLNLNALYLSNNQLTGNIPAPIVNLTNLNALTLNDNQMTGSIPEWLADIGPFSFLTLQNNQLSGCYADELSQLCDNLASWNSRNAYISNGNNFGIMWEDFCNGTYCGDRSAQEGYALATQSFPNPFTDNATITYTLPKDSPVTLTIYDSAGRQVFVLHNNEVKTVGTHTTIFRGKPYPAGVYYYTIQAGEYFGTQKMVLMK